MFEVRTNAGRHIGSVDFSAHDHLVHAFRAFMVEAAHLSAYELYSVELNRVSNPYLEFAVLEATRFDADLITVNDYGHGIAGAYSVTHDNVLHHEHGDNVLARFAESLVS